MKIAFVFPGQGTQYVGMGRDIYDNFDEAKAIYNMADKSLPEKISTMCFEGPEDLLLDTVNQQPTIHTTEIAILHVLRSYGIRPDVTAGFSLGEYAALVCAGVLKFEDTIRIVKKRGEIIQACVPKGVGKMAAISGLSRQDVMDIVKEASKLGTIECSNFNCPGQIIVSGYNDAVDEAAKLAEKRNAKNVSFLKVSAPFHTSLLKDAGTLLGEQLKDIDVDKPVCGFIPNVTGKSLKSGDDIRNLLDLHVSYPVLWEDTINEMLDMGINIFVEIGPSGSLTKFNKRTAVSRGKKAIFFSIENTFEVMEFVDFMRVLLKKSS